MDARLSILCSCATAKDGRGHDGYEWLPQIMALSLKPHFLYRNLNLNNKNLRVLRVLWW